jgi:hypothetical protein
MKASTNREPGISLFWGLFVLWIISFTLPAVRSSNFPNGFSETDYGYHLAFISIYFVWVPYFGQLWIVNIFMLLAPSFVKRSEPGKRSAYVYLLAIAAILPLPLLFMKTLPLVLNAFRAWLLSFYVWQGSLLGMAIWFVLFRRGYWRKRSEDRAMERKSEQYQISVWSPWKR